MIAALTAFYLAIAAAGSDEPQVPEPFLGLWAVDSSACDDFESPDLLEILEDRLQFYEWGADVTSVEVRGDLSARFYGEWWDINETDTDEKPIVRRKSAGMTLSPDRTRLTLAIDDSSKLYVRCPAA